MKQLMKSTTVVFFTLIVSLLGFYNTVEAYPKLQLDIDGGVYDPVTETVMATTNPFNLYAFATPSDGKFTVEKILTLEFALAVSITPQTSTVGDYGSFTLNGTTYNVTGDMVYGTPTETSGDLPSHGVFDTFFLEIPVVFSELDQVYPYNTQDNAGAGLFDTNGSGMLYDAFEIDMTLLDPSLGLHFDLYRVKDDGSVGIFSPFSHDAGSGPPVPEPTTFLLVGSGMAALGLYRRRRNLR